jgi:two-component system response regulator AtoC
MGQILVIDDEADVRTVLTGVLEAAGHDVIATSTIQEAHQILKEWNPDILFCDLFFDDSKDGMTLLAHVQTLSPRPIIIMMSGYGSIEMAVESMKEGADDFLTKPINQAELVTRVERYLELQTIQKEVSDLRIQNLRLQSEIEDRYSFGNLVGQSPAIKHIFDLIRKVADSDKTALILGESGTGKELVAKALHYNSLRKDKPLVIQNCAAIPRELLESELFGHVRGSFTGATRDKPGLFELANHGTFFLDEIGDLDGLLQAKILRVVEDGIVRRIGDTTGKKVDIRLICATSQNLEEKIQQGAFRTDLYYRLNVITIKLPPLRERKDDLPLLIRYFLSKQEKETGIRIRGFSRNAISAMEAYPWPGNIRELENAIEQAVTFAGDKQILDIENLPTAIRQTPNIMLPDPPENLPLPETLEQVERNLILRTLEKTGGNKSLTAKLLGVNRTYLYSRLEKYNLIQSFANCQDS